MTTKIFKIAHNRGNARIWIEGKILLENGFHRNMGFSRVFSNDDENILILGFAWPHIKKQHSIAGTNERPIIDMNGKYLTNFFDGFTHYKAEFFKKSETPSREAPMIVITRLKQ